MSRLYKTDAPPRFNKPLKKEKKYEIIIKKKNLMARCGEKAFVFSIIFSTPKIIVQ